MEWLHEWDIHEYRLGSGSSHCFNASLSNVNVFARNRKSLTSRGAPTGISTSISFQHPFNRAGGRTSNVGQMTMRHILNILGLFWICVGVLSCGRPRNDVLLKNHLGSLDPSKTTRIEIDFARINSSRDGTAWFYIEASEPIISNVLRAEGFSPDVSNKTRVLTRITISAKMPKEPRKNNLDKSLKIA